MNNDQNCRSYEELLAESVGGQLSDRDRERLASHLATCAQCREVSASFGSVVDIVTSVKRDDPGNEFWDGYFERLQERMDPTPSPLVPRERLSIRARIGLALIRSGLHPAAFRRYAFAVVLIGFGFLLGRGFFSAGVDLPIDEPDTRTQHIVRASATEERAFSYLVRSKTLLLGLINFDPQSDDAELLNLPKRRVIADELLGEAVELRKELSETDQHRLEKMIADLELILIQIANIESNYGLHGVEILRNGVDQTGLLLRINVEEMRRNAVRKKPSSDKNTEAAVSL